MYSSCIFPPSDSCIPHLTAYYQDICVCVIFPAKDVQRRRFGHTVCFVYKNIPYFLCKVNALNRYLIFFIHHVHFQHCFFGNNHIKYTLFFKKLQNGKNIFDAKYTNESLIFMVIAYELQIMVIRELQIVHIYNYIDVD